MLSLRELCKRHVVRNYGEFQRDLHLLPNTLRSEIHLERLSPLFKVVYALDTEPDAIYPYMSITCPSCGLQQIYEEIFLSRSRSAKLFKKVIFMMPNTIITHNPHTDRQCCQCYTNPHSPHTDYDYDLQRSEAVTVFSKHFYSNETGLIYMWRHHAMLT